MPLSCVPVSVYTLLLLSNVTAEAVGFQAVCSFVNDRLNSTVLRSLKEGGVRFIALRSAGFNNVDLAEAGRLGLKVARVPEGNALLDIERKTLTTLLGAAGDTTYRNYLPALVDSFATIGRSPQRINVFRLERGFHTLEQVHEQHPALDAA